ncbi:MAG: hypothetical protein LBC19_14765, partial [Tannerella sp.]|nr:hypothetical protein [Tannerella sp.]
MFRNKNAYAAFSSVFERYKKPYVLLAYSYIRNIFVFVSAIIAKNVYSQNARVSINKENTVIQEILDEIENQT